MSATTESIEAGVSWVAAAMPRHYASAEDIASVLVALGKADAARFLIEKQPTSLRARSGELGEIIGTQYASRELGYRMIPRLRWKDSREMPMRGDDLLGIRIDEDGELTLLKGEAKSRAYLSKSTLNEAETALVSNHGRPSSHALSFVASRLFEMGQESLRLKILAAQLGGRIHQRQVTHIMFTLSGNSPRKILQDHTEAYRGRIRRLAVGLQVPEHQVFIRTVYEKVIQDARAR